MNQTVGKKAPHSSMELNVARQRFILNTSSDIGRIGVNIVINVLLAPFLIQKIGIEAYGIVGLTLGFQAYIRLFAQSISGPTLRFITLNQDDNCAEANRFFNSSFKALLLISVVALIPVTAFCWALPSLFQVPSGFENEAMILCFCILSGALVSGTAGPIKAVYAWKHCFFLQNALTTASRLFAVAILLLSFRLLGYRLACVGIYYAAYFVFEFTFLFAGHIRFQNTIRLRAGLFSWSDVRRLTGVGTLLILFDLAHSMIIWGTVLVVNLSLGALANGYLAPILQAAMLLQMVSVAIGLVLRPVFFEFVRRDDRDMLAARLQQALRIMGYIMGFPLIIVAGMARPLLSLWLGDEFAGLWPALALFSFALYYGNIIFVPYRQVFRASQGLFMPVVITAVIAVIHLVFLFVALNALAGTVVVAAGVVAATMLLGILPLSALHCDYLIHQPWGTTAKAMHKCLWAPIVPTLLIVCYNYLYQNVSLAFLTGAIVCSVYLIWGFFAMLTADDRHQLILLVPFAHRLTGTV